MEPSQPRTEFNRLEDGHAILGFNFKLETVRNRTLQGVTFIVRECEKRVVEQQVVRLYFWRNDTKTATLRNRHMINMIIKTFNIAIEKLDSTCSESTVL